MSDWICSILCCKSKDNTAQNKPNNRLPSQQNAKGDFSSIGNINQAHEEDLEEEIKENQFDQVLAEAKSSGSKFTDGSFPASKVSLIKDWESSDPEIQALVPKWEKYEWIRATEIKSLNGEGGELKVFAGQIEPNDIKQGALGNCYFLSVLSVLTEDPDRVRKLFVSEEVNAEGVYGLNVTKNGVKVQVILDDFFPCEDGEPSFSQANGKELWVLLMEKCWAKLHGSYARIIGGQSHLTLRDLTGAPSFEHETSAEDAWQKIKEADEKNYILCAGISDEDEAGKEKLKELGLVAQHSYGLIAVLECNDADGNALQLLKLRNPWGKFEWKGAWGDESELWTDELKQKAGLTNEDDGCFWMCFDDFKNYFGRYQICQYRNDFKFSSHKIQATQLGLYFNQIHVHNKGHHTFAVSQVDERCLPPRDNFSYSSCKITILDSAKTIVGATQGFQERDAYVEIENMEPGTYTMIVDMEWDEHQVFDAADPNSFIAINCYGVGPVRFGKSVTPEQHGLNNCDQLLHLFMEQAVSNLIKGELPEHVDKLEMTDNSERLFPKMVRYEYVKRNEEDQKDQAFGPFGSNSGVNGYNWILLVNGESHATFHESVEYSTFDGLQFVQTPPNSHNNLSGENAKEARGYEMVVPPQKQCFILIRTNASGFGSASSMSRRIRFDDATLLKMAQESENSQERAEKITVKEFTHDFGVVNLYENSTADQVLKEELDLDLKEMTYQGDFKVVDESVPKVCMVVKPGEAKVLRFDSTGADTSYSYSMAYSVIPQDQFEE